VICEAGIPSTLRRVHCRKISVVHDETMARTGHDDQKAAAGAGAGTASGPQRRGGSGSGSRGGQGNACAASDSYSVERAIKGLYASQAKGSVHRLKVDIASDRKLL
jgi:hypothetical protein